jgi:hypothetical protein
MSLEVQIGSTNYNFFKVAKTKVQGQKCKKDKKSL